MPDMSGNLDLKGIANAYQAMISSNQQEEVQELAEKIGVAKQENSPAAMQDETVEAGEARQIEKKTKTLDTRREALVEKKKEQKSVESVAKKEEGGDEKSRSADDFNRQNPALKKDKLLSLLDKIAKLKNENKADPKSIMETVKGEFKDPDLIHLALQFLSQNTKENPALQQAIKDTQKTDQLSVILGKVNQLKQQNQVDSKSILEAVKSEFKDPYLINQALEFVIDNNKDDPSLYQIANDTQKQYYMENKTAIEAGKNINEIANKYASKSSKEPSELRDLYRDITTNPRDTKDLFDELSKKYPTLKDLQRVLKFLYNALGKDLNSKGPSIEAGELKNLIDETKTLQAISGVYKYFQGRTQLLTKLAKEFVVQVPQGFNFQTLSKQFISFLKDRYPTSDKVLGMADKMGFHTTSGKILIIEAERDAVRQISSRLYNSDVHRQEVSTAIQDALEKLYQDEEMELDQSNTKEYRSHLTASVEPPKDKKAGVIDDFYGDPNLNDKQVA